MEYDVIVRGFDRNGQDYEVVYATESCLDDARYQESWAVVYAADEYGDNNPVTEIRESGYSREDNGYYPRLS